MKYFLLTSLFLFTVIVAPVIEESSRYSRMYNVTDLEAHHDQSTESQAEKDQSDSDPEDQYFTKSSLCISKLAGSINSCSAAFRNQFRKGYPHMIDEPPELLA